MPATWTPIWLSQADIENAVSPDTAAACFDDGNSCISTTAVLLVITQAEMEVLSWLGDYGPPPFSSQTLAQLGSDSFLKSCAVEFAKYYTFDRHPEYVRSNGKDQQDRWDRAEKRMERVLDARQRPPTTTVPTQAVGGATIDDGPRIYVDDASGRRNSGDY
jgi:hypothetical protein